MSESLTAALLIILGWLFGLLTPIITNHNRRVRENREVSRALQVELSELKYRLACTVYRINMHNGTVSRDLLEWLKPIFKNYTGVNPFNKIQASINMQLELTDEQIKILTDHDKADSSGGLSMKKYNVPLLETKFALISSFNTTLQNQLIELRTNLSMLNEEVDQARYYFNLTFDSNLSTTNHEIININLDKTYTQYSVMARKIVNQLNSISWGKGI